MDTCLHASPLHSLPALGVHLSKNTRKQKHIKGKQCTIIEKHTRMMRVGYEV